MEIFYFIKRLFFFSFLFLLFYILLIIIWGEFEPNYLKSNISYQKFASGHLTSRIKEVREFKDVDLLFLGSSRSYRHYDTRIFDSVGIVSFNLGSSSQTLIQSKYLFKKYGLDLKPKYVVFDIYPGMLTGNGIESTLDIISNEELSFDLIKFVLDYHNTFLIYNTLIYSIYKEYFHNIHEKEEPTFKVKKQDMYISGGYVKRDLKFSKPKPVNAKNIDFSDIQIEAFMEIIKLCKKKEINLILVQSPMHQNHYESYLNLKKIDSLARNANIPYFDLGNKLNLNDSVDFYDPMHLNHNGVQKYNQWIIYNIFRKLK